MPAATWGFAIAFRRICADRDIVPISLCASPFHQICRVQKYRKTAFVQLALQENRYSIQPKPLTIPIPVPSPIQTNDPPAVSANPTKEKAKHHVAVGMDSLSPQ